VLFYTLETMADTTINKSIWLKKKAENLKKTFIKKLMESESISLMKKKQKIFLKKLDSKHLNVNIILDI
jgi:hypothetical protein